MAAEKMTPLTSLPPAPQRFSDDPDVFSERAEETSEALVAMVNELNTGVIPQFNSTVEPMNQVLSNLTDIKTVSDITPAVVSVAGIKGNVLSVDSVKPQIVRVSQSATNLDRVHTSIGAVDTVSSHIANVDTVAVKIVDVASVAGHMANVDTVATHMDNVDTTVAHMASVDSVAGNMADVQAVAGISSAVSTVAAANETLTRLDAQTPMLTRVDAIRADVTTVAGIEAEVASVAGDRDVINTVHAALPKIEAVETNLPHIVAVDNAETAIRLAGLHINTIDAVGGNMPAVQAVAGNLGDIAKVTADMPHVKVVAEHTANVDAVGRNIAAVQEVDRRLQLVIDAPGNATIAAEAAAEAARQAGLAKQHADSASAVAGLPVATDANDQQPVIWDKDLRKFGFGQPGGAALLPAPAVTAPALLPVGFAVAFTLTGLPGLVGTEIASFQWQVNDGEMQDFTATSNSYTGTLTAQGADAAVWTLKARAIDSKGNVSLWNQTTAVLVTPRVTTPTVTAPFAGAIVSNQTVALASSAFAATHLADTHKASRWILSTDAAGNNILHDSGWRQDALTAYTAVMSPVADADTPIFAHVQHEGAKVGQSDKSVAVQVHTSYVLRPAVTSPLLSTMVGTERIELTCAAFATFAGSFDTHVASRWWVTTDATGNNALCDSGWTSDYLTEYTAVLSPLADPASDLYLWVEHRGALLGDSAKSASVRVVTGSLQTPGVVSPAAGTIVLPTAFTVTGSSFAAVAGATDTMRALYVQVATDELFTSKVYDSGRVLTASESHALTFAVQTQGAALFVRLRYEGTTLGISGWSAPVRVVVTQVQTPAINSPVEGATGVPVKPLMTMTAYAATGNLDTGANTQVQIATDATFASITYDSGEMAYTTSHTVVTALTPAAGQCARFRHKGQILGWTPWSASVNFTTGMVQTPSIVSPAEGGFILPTTFTAVCSPFVALGATDTLKAVTLQVAKDIGFTNMVYNQRHVGASTSIAVTLPEQTQGSTLYLRAMYEGNALGASEWSAARRLVVTQAQAPSVVSPVNGATDVALRPTIQLSPWSDTGGLDTGSKTRVQVSKVSNFSSIAWDSGEVAYTTSVQVGVDLEAATQYYTRGLHSGARLGTTGWSVTVGVVTVSGNSMTILTGAYYETLQHMNMLDSNSYVFSGVFNDYGNEAGAFLGYGTIQGQTAVSYDMLQTGAGRVIIDTCLMSNGKIAFCGDICVGIASITGGKLSIDCMYYITTPGSDDNQGSLSCIFEHSSGLLVVGGYARAPVSVPGKSSYTSVVVLFSVNGNSMTILDAKYLATGTSMPNSMSSFSQLSDKRYLSFCSRSYNGIYTAYMLFSISNNTIQISTPMTMYSYHSGFSQLSLNYNICLNNGYFVSSGYFYSNEAVYTPIIAVGSVSGSNVTINNTYHVNGGGIYKMGAVCATGNNTASYCATASGRKTIVGGLTVNNGALSFGECTSIEVPRGVGVEPLSLVYHSGLTQLGGWASISQKDAIIFSFKKLPYSAAFPAPAGWKCETFTPTATTISASSTTWSPSIGTWNAVLATKTNTPTPITPTVNVYPF